ncbi:MULTISPECIES: gamma-glutamyl-gamma-aminobutyrate hydrolase family protein [unclassified Clostridium]|uniref:gamma-glutamyl-gamma-aminobutyrate hydrolase family protein n=1 Tax=unclassified Clostridium TaxID=2614128 RepID=UPI00189B9168|nr:MULTISPECIES: gamma-glutamyl-gamma-aminobutyrate hydrolase family protein [unclassified Clostridium]MCR1951116.1 gamma-glutamyl-gamma-aminobutyrate hydrolase family protein [Clostridium sp. DSM 100503]
MNKPIIGVTALFDDEKESIWMLPSYLDAITDAGGIPVILPIIDNEEDIKTLANKFDGFLLAGGQDINPEIYKEKKLAHCGGINVARDKMEKSLLKEILTIDKPLLAICRGFQLLNSYLGGSLYQDIKIDRNNNKDSIHRQEKPYNKPSHKVIVKKNSLLFDIMQKEEIMVNSMHHQAIKNVSPNVTDAAISEDGVIESIYIKDRKFVLGVQWHPEHLYKDYEEQFNIFKEFINRCS